MGSPDRATAPLHGRRSHPIWLGFTVVWGPRLADQRTVAVPHPRPDPRQVGLSGAHHPGEAQDSRAKLRAPVWNVAFDEQVSSSWRPGELCEFARVAARRTPRYGAAGSRLSNSGGAHAEHRAPQRQAVEDEKVGGRDAPRAKQHSQRLDSNKGVGLRQTRRSALRGAPATASAAQRAPEIASRLLMFESTMPGPQAWKRQRLCCLNATSARDDR